jgi:hypothetical protein
MPHDLVPPRRSSKVPAGLGAQAPYRVHAASEDVFGREVIAGVLEFERARNIRAEVMLGDATERNQRPGVGSGQAPAIEADHALKVSNRLALNRKTIKGRPA